MDGDGLLWVWDTGNTVYSGVDFGFWGLISVDSAAWRFHMYKLGCNGRVAMRDEYKNICFGEGMRNES